MSLVFVGLLGEGVLVRNQSTKEHSRLQSAPTAAARPASGAHLFPEIWGSHALVPGRVGAPYLVPCSPCSPLATLLKQTSHLWVTLIFLFFPGLGTSFHPVPLSFSLPLPREGLGWSFQSLSQKRQEERLSCGSPAPPPPASWVSEAKNMNGLDYLLRICWETRGRQMQIRTPANYPATLAVIIV